MDACLSDPICRALDKKCARFEEIEKLLQDPDVFQDPSRVRLLTRERGTLSQLVEKYQDYLKNKSELEDCRLMLEDPEMVETAQEEIETLEKEIEELVPWIEGELLQADEDSSRDVIFEIRAGTGGDEASLFVADLFRMYSRYCSDRGWKVELINSNDSEGGGLKEVSFEVKGQDVYRYLRFESGGHRVQRVPTTESQGRIHTSLVTVAVMPQVEEVEVTIDPSDIRVDVMRASGPGGQSVNTTDSAVRITHLPTDLVVVCMDEKSQIKNKAKAMNVLRSRLYLMEQQRVKSEHDELRRTQIGSGDRSERIRTYNFPQGRLSDHRLSENLYNLDAIMEGDLSALFEKLQIWDRQKRIVELND